MYNKTVKTHKNANGLTHRSSFQTQERLSTITRALQPVATCRQSPYLHKPAIIIMTSFSL